MGCPGGVVIGKAGQRDPIGPGAVIGQHVTRDGIAAFLSNDGAIINSTGHIIAHIDFDGPRGNRPVAIGGYQTEGDILDQVFRLTLSMIQGSDQIECIAESVGRIARQRHGQNRRAIGRTGNRHAIIGQGVCNRLTAGFQAEIGQFRCNFQLNRIGCRRPIFTKVDIDRARDRRGRRSIRSINAVTVIGREVIFVDKARANCLRSTIRWEGDFRPIVANHQMNRRCIRISVPISQRIGEVISDIRATDILNIAIGSIAPGAIRIDCQGTVFRIDGYAIDRINQRRSNCAAAFRCITDFCNRRFGRISAGDIIIRQQIAGNGIVHRLPSLLQAIFAIIHSIWNIIAHINVDQTGRHRSIAIRCNDTERNIFNQIV